MKNLLKTLTGLAFIFSLFLPASIIAQCDPGDTYDTYCYDDGEMDVVAFEFCPSAGDIAQSTIIAGSYSTTFPAAIEGLTIYEGTSGSGTSGTVVLGPVDGDLTGTVITASAPDLCLIFVSNSNLFFIGISCVDGFETTLEVCSESLPGTTVTFTAPDDLCINAGVQTGLSGGSPTGGVYSGPGVTDDGNGMTYSFDPAAAGVGVHTLTYTNGGSASDDVEVFAIPTVTFTAPADLCIDAGVQTGLGGGSPTGGIYSGPGVTDDGNGMTYSFDPAVAGLGVHSITYTEGGICMAASSDDIEVLAACGCPAPETSHFHCGGGVETNLVVFEVCPTPGMAAKANIIAGTYNTSGNTLTVYEGVSGSGTSGTLVFGPASGDLSGTVISGLAADQCLIFVNNSPSGIGCQQGFETALEVCGESIAPSLVFTAPDDLCVDVGVQTGLGGGLPTGGVYSGPGVTDDGNGMTYNFDPAAAGVGVHTLTYTNGGSASDDIEIFPVGSPACVSFIALDDLCIDAGVQPGLGGGLPTGGVYSGPGVTDDSNGMTYSFDPGAAGIGIHTLTYTVGGNPASDDVAVFDLPVVTFTAPPDACSNDNGAQYDFLGSPVGGVYSGPGVTDIGIGTTFIFEPQDAGVGVHTITYTYTDANGCTNSASDDVEVFDGTPAAFTAPADLCIDAGVQAGLGGGTPTGGTYSGSGVTDDGNGMTYSFDPPAAGVGIHTITYSIAANAACPASSASDDVEVFALPTVTFNIPAAQDTICIDAAVDLITFAGSPTGGVYSGPGVMDLGTGTSFNFDPAAAGLGLHILTYTYTDANGCTGSDTDFISVQPLPTVNFTAPADLCVDAGLQAGLGGGTPIGGVYSGPGVTDDGNGMTYSFDPAAAGVGVHTITYTYTQPFTGCINSAEDDVEVFGLPDVDFTAPAPTVCVQDPPVTGLGGGMPSGGTYIGLGVTDDGNGMTFTFDPTASAPAGGNIPVTYTFTDANGCTNSATDDIFVNSICCMLEVTCPTANDLGTFDCNTIGNIPAHPTTQAEAEAAPYNIIFGTDPCGTILVSSSDDMTIMSCGTVNQTITRTVFIWDDLPGGTPGVFDTGTEESASCTYTYTFVPDTTPPMITTCPPDQPMVEGCGPADVINASALPLSNLMAVAITAQQFMNEGGVATDNCGITSYAYEDQVLPGTCPWTVQRTFILQDACGNFATCVQIFTIDDTTPPVPPTPPGPVMVQCAEDIPPPVDLTAQDACDGAITASPTAVITPGVCDNQFTMVRTWIFTDGCLNSSSVSQTITVFDDTAPVLSFMPANTTVECDAIPAPAVITATDNCLAPEPVLFINEIHYDDSGADQGEFIEIAGTAGIDLSAYELAAYDSDNLLDDIRVLSGVIPDEGNGYGAIAFFLGDLSSQFFENGPREGRALVETGVGVTDFISYEGVVNAANGPAMGLTSFNIGTEPSNTPAGQSLQQTGAGCTVGSFTWIGPVTDSPGTLNAGQTIDPAQCAISNNVTVFFTETIIPGNCPQESTIIRTWSAEDACGNPVSHTQTITVEDTTIPVFCNPPVDITVDCVAPAAEDVTGRDNCDFGGLTGPVWINEIHYDNTGGDVGEFIEIAGVAGTDLSGYQLVAYDSDDLLDDQRAISGIIPNEDCGFGAIAFFLGDLSSQFFENGPEEGRALVDATGKVIDFISYEGIVNAANGPAMGLTSLNIGEEPFTTPAGQSLQLVRTPGGGPGFDWIGPADDSPGALNENQAGLLLGVLTEVDNSTICDGGTVTRTWTLEDACGNAAPPHVQVITILPPPPPVITCPADQTVECIDDFVLDPTTATATSLCNNIVAIYIKNPLISGVPNCDGTVYTYIYVAVDDCGKSSECEQQVLIQNDPATISVPAGGVVNCFEDIDISVDDATVNGACADYNLYLVPPTSNGDLGCPGATYTFIYRLIDACGRIVEEPVVFTNGANDGPTITAPVDISCDCLAGVNPNPDNATVTTSCTIGSTVTVAGPQIFGPIDCPNTVYRYTYTVTDDCGRTATDTQDFTVQNGPPVFENCPGDNWLVLNCEDYGGEGGTIAVIEAWIASVTASSSCGVPLTVFNNFNSNNINTCINNGYNTVTFRATDACGRTSFCTGVYVVVDTEAPIITTPAQDHWEMCNYNTQANLTAWVQNQGGAIAYDGCSNDNISWQASPANPQINCIGAMGTTTVTVTFIVTDNCGNKTSTTATFNALMAPGNDLDAPKEEQSLLPESTDQIDLFQNQPNPFKNETLIGFYLPEAMEASLVIYDISGKEIKRISGDYAKGYNSLVINRSELNATGFLLYQLQTEMGSMTKRMILMER